jgi:hypothetical protein
LLFIFARWKNVIGGAAAVHLAEKILAVNFESKANAFCLPCEIAFDMQEDNGHATHGWINIIADSGHRPRVRVPTKHLSILEWKEIKDVSSALLQFILLITFNVLLVP